jgi:hypothetical protein
MFERVYFAQGKTAEPVLEALDKRGPEHMLRSLAAKFHDSGHHETAAEPFHGPDDGTFEKDDYILSWNSRIGYVGLDYRIEDVPKNV